MTAIASETGVVVSTVVVVPMVTPSALAVAVVPSQMSDRCVHVSDGTGTAVPPDSNVGVDPTIDTGRQFAEVAGTNS